ncbi:MAG: bifunctional DNA-formamidopyrimidine glycosylase/DNA-(apurinic or apyrimidinic site) lyase [Candidatus Dasytiphilus stammeri]
MPELPEVENICRSLEKYFVGKTIIFAKVRNNNLKFPISKEIFNIRNQKILSINRRSKYLIMKLNQGSIIIHLGMSGTLRIVSLKTSYYKHDHIDLVMNNKTILRYTDPRKFGSWRWSDNPDMCEYIKKLGPEPLSTNFSVDYLFQKTRSSNLGVKPFLMNTKFVAGIGNIYANESLFLAGILPFRKILTLNWTETQKLVESIVIVLQCSINNGGTSLQDFCHLDGKKGNFSKLLNVYGRTGKSCNQCGRFIERIILQQRSTFFCRNCQI